MSKGITARELVLTHHSGGPTAIRADSQSLDIGLSSRTRAFTIDKTNTTLRGSVLIDKEDGGGAERVLTKADLALANVVTGQTQVAAGSATQTGNFYFVKASPSPIAMIDSLGRVDSFNMWHLNFQDYIMGFSETAKAAAGQVYGHGLVPAGNAVHANKFLRQDGQWAQPTELYTGTVAENFLSLNDTPTSYTDKSYLQVKFDSSFPSGAGLVQTRDLTDVNTLTCAGVCKAQSFICTSDKRSKQCIEPLENPLQKITELKPVTFAYRTNPKRKTAGMLAQDMQETSLKHLVVEDKDGRLAVDYTGVISNLVGAVRQLADEISQLKVQRKPTTK